MSEVIYISGRMSGIPTADFEAEFAYWAQYYRDKGFTVINPVELDDGDYTMEKRDYLARDIYILLGSDRWRLANCMGPRMATATQEPVTRLYMLPSWRDSEGGCYLEKFAAETVGIPVYDAVTEKPLEELPMKVAS